LPPFRPALFVVTEERPPGDHVQGKAAQVLVVQELLEQARLLTSTNSFFFVGSSRQAGRQARAHVAHRTECFCPEL
jgi:hypothetical protein